MLIVRGRGRLAQMILDLNAAWIRPRADHRVAMAPVGVRVVMMMVMQISPHRADWPDRTPHSQSTHYLDLLAHCLHHPWRRIMYCNARRKTHIEINNMKIYQLSRKSQSKLLQGIVKFVLEIVPRIFSPRLHIVAS